jgi:hypothetical protein
MDTLALWQGRTNAGELRFWLDVRVIEDIKGVAGTIVPHDWDWVVGRAIDVPLGVDVCTRTKVALGTECSHGCIVVASCQGSIHQIAVETEGSVGHGEMTECVWEMTVLICAKIAVAVVLVVLEGEILPGKK